MKKILSILFACLFSVLSYAQNSGVISGYLQDSEAGRPLPGATITLDKYNRYTISDNNGHYEFLNVPEGTYRVEVIYIGYNAPAQSATVKAGENVLVDFVMDEYSYELGAAVVMGDMLRGQAKALNTQKTNANISNVISADQVGRFPDANIGDALKRVPGISMQNDQGEARNIIVRGLASELNSVMLNGNRIPSAEGDNRKVQMDLIPSDMIQTIEVNKTITPDMDGDAIGGSVDLITRAATGGQRLSATLAGGYNPIREGFTGTAGLVYGNRFFNDKFGMVISASYMNKDYGSDNIEATWKEDDEGNIYAAEMELRKYDVQRVRRSISANLDYKIDENNTISADIMYNWRDDRENRYALSYKDIEPIYGDGGVFEGYEGTIARQTKGGIDNNRNRKRRLEDQRVQSYALNGRHLLSSKFDLDWNISYSKASEDRPNERYIEFRQEGVSILENLADTYKPVVSSPDENLSLFTFDELTENHDFTKEDELSAKINARVPLTIIKDQKGRLRFGLRARFKDKERENDLFKYEPVGDFPVLADMETKTFGSHLHQGAAYVPGTFVSNSYLGNVNIYDGSKFEAEADPEEYLVSNYSAKERILAAYIRWDQDITDKLSYIVGVRAEHTHINYDGNYITNEDYDNAENRSRENSYINFLPSLSFKYNVSDNFILRAAFSTALARPNYYALVPYLDVKQDKGEIVAGNPNLEATYSYNFDLMAEYYFKNIGIVSGGFFYKKLDNFIYTYMNSSYTTDRFAEDFPNLANPIPAGETWEYTVPLNGESVNLYGVEVALQRKLDFLPGKFLKNFSIYLNYTYTGSKASGIYNEDGEERTDVDFPGTTPHMFNASLSWENKRFSARVSLNYAASYLDEVADEAFSDRYYDKQLFLDVNASYKIGGHFTIFGEANNLTNTPLRYYQGVKSRLAQLEYYKPTFNIGVKFNL